MSSEEKVLAIPTEKLFEKGKWNGFRQTNLGWYRSLINDHGIFIPRVKAENNPGFKQVIPQIIFTYQKKIFFHRIHQTGGESRLHDMYPIFLGGHVDPIDKSSEKDMLNTAAEREFFEEVQYDGKFIKQKFIGLVNQLTKTVNQVHIGFVFIFEGNSNAIRSNETEIAEAGMVSINKLKPYVSQMTYWSQLVFPHLDKLINK